ncbi:MAG: type II secretion system protein [Candidatus Saganbacteria bacterium]|nr:type II secretion system protein [Candidatus Saganbacteria bacterium]
MIKIKKNKGFTLLELMIGMLFIVLAAALVSMALVQGLQLFYAQDNRTALFVNGESVLDGMIMDLRHATSFVTTTSSNLCFISNGSTILYSWDDDAKILNKTTAGNTVSLLSGVEDFSFSYDNPTNAKFVSVYMVLKDADNVITTFESGGGPRNL